MVFEVHYYNEKERRSSLSSAAIRRALAQVDFLKENRSDPGTFRYHNPDTRVECEFLMYEPEEDYEVGLAALMALPRPTFFSLECLPLVVQIARELRLQLAVVEPGPVGKPERASMEMLMERWRAANREEIRYIAEDGTPPPRANLDDLETMWEFMTLRPDLNRRYKRRSIPVPPVDLVQLKKTGQVFRCADWSGLGSTVLPEIEWFRLVDPPKPLKGDTYYAFEELGPILKAWFRDVPQPVYHRLCDKTVPSDELVAALQQAEHRTGRSFERIEYHEVVDDDAGPPPGVTRARD
ncbi:MAG: hypothetical protein HY319_13370 [Armatimonadetes bacterium]|nr:hypothetical protein [Armatimonadota bacterium]